MFGALWRPLLKQVFKLLGAWRPNSRQGDPVLHCGLGSWTARDDQSQQISHLFKHIVSPVGFKGNRALHGHILFFPEGLSKWKT